MKKKQRYILWLIALIFVCVIVSTQIYIPRVKFIEVSTNEMIAIMNRDFPEIFPQIYTDLRGARADLRECDMFVLRLTMDEQAEKKLLDTLSNYEQVILPYNIDEDSRLYDKYYPSWYKQPITKGYKIGAKLLKSHYGQRSNSISHLYIDNSNSHKVILYIDGLFMVE